MNLPADTSRNIVIFCDGTGNDEATNSNVRKLFDCALGPGDSQFIWYDPGVGTGTSWQSKFFRIVSPVRGKLRALLELGLGLGISENIKQGYQQIVENYHKDDRIYIFGFSRGAYTARCIAGVIARVGLLKKENASHLQKVMKFYRECRPKQNPPLLRPEDLPEELFHKDVKVHFLGVWDTVASLGVPMWGWWFRPAGINNEHFTNEPAAVCQTVRHAISMDERRSQFFVTMFDENRYDGNIEQRWFRGSHAGVGGGYRNTGLSDIAFNWMLGEATKHGLLIKPLVQSRFPDPFSPIESELQKHKIWYMFKTWPRWFPCLKKEANETQGCGCLDDSVYVRSDAATTANKYPTLNSDEMLFLPPSTPQAPSPRRILVNSEWQWNRTGLVMEEGGIYKITYVGGKWRDKNCPICGPAGQDAEGLEDIVRHFFGWSKRHRKGKWMELIGTITHPRKWELKQPRLYKIFSYLWFNDPEELTQSLFPLGRHLQNPGDGVIVENQALGGMLYLFANDAWLFYNNNSGRVELEVERLPLGTSLCGHYVVKPDGKAVWRDFPDDGKQP